MSLSRWERSRERRVATSLEQYPTLPSPSASGSLGAGVEHGDSGTDPSLEGEEQGSQGWGLFREGLVRR